MNAQSISTGLSPDVIIDQVSGDLYLKGWEKPEVNIISPQEAHTLEEENDKIHLSCQSDCEVRIPQNASLQIQKVQGNAFLKLVDGTITIGVVQGSLTTRDVAALRVEMVHNNLSSRGVSDNMSVNQVKGNAEIRKVRGNCSLEDVLGKLDCWDVEGETKVRAHGRIYLRLSAMRGVDYQIHSESNVHCYIPEDASVKLDLSSRSKIIKIRLGEKTATVHQSHYELTTDGGNASMSISSGGSIYLLSRKPEWKDNDDTAFEKIQGFDWEDFNPEIAQQGEDQIGARMESVTDRLNEEITRITERIGETGLSPEATNRIKEHVRRASEREIERAQEKMRRTQEKLERKLEGVQRHRGRRAEEFDRRTRHGRQSWSFQSPMTASQTLELEKEAISDEERLLILRMLEQKKITLEEADRLLAVLEGREE